MDRYLNRLNEDILNGLVVYGCKPACEEGDYAVKHNETMKVAETCNHCGGPVIGPYVKTGYGTFHSYCHGAAQRSLRHRFMKES